MIALVYSNLAQRADLSRAAGMNLDTDEGLETAVVVSLFTDDRAQESDDIDPIQSPGGWWGAKYLDQPGGLGSRLWLLRRRPLTEDSMVLCSKYAQDALQWMIEAGVASDVSASTSLYARVRNAATLAVNITRPGKLGPRFSKAWQVQFGV